MMRHRYVPVVPGSVVEKVASSAQSVRVRRSEGVVDCVSRARMSTDVTPRSNIFRAAYSPSSGKVLCGGNVLWKNERWSASERHG